MRFKLWKLILLILLCVFSEIKLFKFKRGNIIIFIFLEKLIFLFISEEII